MRSAISLRIPCRAKFCALHNQSICVTLSAYNRGFWLVLYSAYEMQRAWLEGLGTMAGVTSRWLDNPANLFGYIGGGPAMASALDVFAHAAAPRGKPRFNLPHTEIDGAQVAVRENVALAKPFGNLLHFAREGAPITGKGADPKLLIVAPMSGHYATLLRGTVERMLPAQDVYITDWADARTVSLDDGQFDLDDYIDYVIEFLQFLGPDTHVIAVCQPSVPVLAATAIMNARKDKCLPATLTMMGGPIDTRQSPTVVNSLAVTRPHAWFQQNVIATVPAVYRGAGRRVYPGFLQLTGFMSMNLGNHMMSHWEMFKHLDKGDDDSADVIKEFYEEYRSVCDMTAEFYLQTIDMVFQNHLLPRGLYTHRGEKVDLGAITQTAILAVEGERDDISGIGQTKAALDLSTNLAEGKKKYHLAEGAGHYGIFNGSKWRDSIAPVVEDWIRNHG
jgi:poly(3-hydroxybutyrate) depolymerase